MSRRIYFGAWACIEDMRAAFCGVWPQDGLRLPWVGRVWLNPPFGSVAAKWLARLADHGNGIALIPARTETKMFYASVWGRASSLLFLRGRPHFHFPNGSRAPFNDRALAFSGLGRWVKL